MSRLDSPSGSGSPVGTNAQVTCPCNVQKRGKSLSVTCANQNCKYKLWHASCAGFQNPRQSFLNSIGNWICPLCVVDGLPSNFMKIASDRLEDLYTKLDDIKKELKEELASQKKNINAKIQSYAEVVSNENNETTNAITNINKNLNSVKTKIEIKSDHDNEKRSRDQKALNICVFNIPESDAESVEDQYKDDVTKFQNILSNKVPIRKDDVKAFFRIGKERNSSKPRPIVIKLSNEDIRLKLLKLRNLQYNDDSQDYNIYINPDRTKKEQEIYRKLLSELKERRSKGEENIAIRNGKIVEILPFRRNPQLYWGSAS